MPLFDYRCSECARRFTLLMGVVTEQPDEKCPHCGSENVKRLISRFARVRSEDDVLDSLADPSKMGDLEDPKQLQTWMKRMGKEMGEDLGDDFDEIMAEGDSTDAAADDSLE